MEFESLIFDIDGTLWDTRAMVAEGYNEQLESEGLGHLAVRVEDLTPLFGKVAEDLANVLFAALPQPERMPLMVRCMDHERRAAPDRAGGPGHPVQKDRGADQRSLCFGCHRRRRY